MRPISKCDFERPSVLQVGLLLLPLKQKRIYAVNIPLLRTQLCCCPEVLFTLPPRAWDGQKCCPVGELALGPDEPGRWHWQMTKPLAFSFLLCPITQEHFTEVGWASPKRTQEKHPARSLMHVCTQPTRVSLGCCNKNTMDWATYKQHTLASHSSGGEEARDHGAGRFSVCWGPVFWLMDVIFWPRGRRAKGVVWGLFVRALFPWWGGSTFTIDSPPKVRTSKYHHIGGLDFNRWIWGAHKHSNHSSIILNEINK